jgi:NodT family efflux transporter outer membrane factor (OMF) lipoprotein
MNIRNRTLLAAAGAFSMLAGCAVGPNFKAPGAPVTAGYVPGALSSPIASADGPGSGAQRFIDGLDIPGQWWTLFRSSDLNALIERALANSPTLEAAQAALRQANENLAAGRGSYAPTVSGSVQSERERASSASFGNIPGLPSAFLYSLNSASVNVSYTLDAFGGVRRQVEALQAQAEYEQFVLEASYLSLTANVVTAAVTEASLRAQIAATEEIAAAQQRQLEIVQRRFDAGGSSRSDVLQQQATLQNTLASLPLLRSQLAQERNLLAAYIGVLPADYAGSEFRLDTLHLPEELPVSLPSKLVEQRPDVREYGALLHEASAEIGVATSNLLPQITLSGSYGGEAARFADVFSPGSVVWSLVGGLTQPIFKGGTLIHQRRAAVAAAQQAAANYQATVITAFQNVSNTLAALQADAEIFAAQSAGEQAARDSLLLVQAQFKSGAASYTQVLTAEQTFQNAAVSLVKARAQRYADTAALFQALGGGWWNRADVKANSTDCCKGHL